MFKFYKNITLIFVIWFVVVLFISWFGFLTLPHSEKFGKQSLPFSNEKGNDFLKSFSNWDGGHYLGIAEHGYTEKFQYAFFPLFPITIKIVNYLVNNYLLSAILISVLSAFLSLHILYKLISINFEKKIAEKAVIAMLFFPTSFYFLTVYSEGLFLLLVLLTFFFLGKRNLFLATIFAALASATRLAGLALVLAILVEVQTIHGINKKNWYIILSFSGFIAYCYFLYTKTADPFYFLTAEQHWLRNLTTPVTSFWETIKNIATPGFIEKNITAFLDLIFAIFGLGMVIRSFRFLPVSYAVYGLASIALPLFTSSLSSMPRFLLPIFPIFILMALVKNEQSSSANRYLLFGYQLISILLLGLFTVLFINGYWVS